MFPVQRSETCLLLVIVGLLVFAVPGLTDDYQGLTPGEGRDLTLKYCTTCHSTKMILQNHMTREQWKETIIWMQEKQGLSKLEQATREKILDYLVGTQGPNDKTILQKPIPSHPTGMYLFDYQPNPL